MIGLNLLRFWSGNGYWTFIIKHVGSCNWMMVSSNRWVLGCPRLREAGRGNDMLKTVGWVARMRRRGATCESGDRRIGGANEVEAPTLAKRFLPCKGTGQVGTTKNE